jgi:hypothetical protein
MTRNFDAIVAQPQQTDRDGTRLGRTQNKPKKFNVLREIAQ